MRPTFAILLLYLIGAVVSAPQPIEVPDPASYYQPFQLVRLNTHTHTHHSDATGPGSTLTAVIDANCRRFDGLILTDHGEHLTPAEWRTQSAISASPGKLVLRGFEATGTGEVRGTNLNPAYQHGWGHVIVTNTADFTGTRTAGNGMPPVLCATFTDFKAWLSRQPGSMGIFAHPSLYMAEESFDGFAAPTNEQEADQFVGCELGSHSVRYTGLGNGLDLRSSNEACYRQLLRRGWRVSPYMGGDEHTPPYGTATTITGLFVDERTTNGVLEAMRNRRTFATEEPGAQIQLIAATDVTVLMGGELNITHECTIHARCVTHSSTVQSITLVFVSKRGAFYDVIQQSQPLKLRDEHWGTIVSRYDISDREMCAVYTKARLKNGRELVSAPIWLTTRL